MNWESYLPASTGPLGPQQLKNIERQILNVSTRQGMALAMPKHWWDFLEAVSPFDFINAPDLPRRPS